MANRAMINDIELSMVGPEEVTDTSDITDKKVEDGSPMTDHVSHNPLVVNFTGVLVGDDAFSKLMKIKKLKDNKEFVTFSGRNIFSNMIITQLNRNHGKEIRNGMEFDITLNQVILGSYQTVKINVQKVKVKPKPKPKGKAKPKKKKSKSKVKAKKQKAKKTKVTRKTNKGRVQKKKRPPGPKLTHNFINPMRPGPIMKESSPYY